VELLHSINNPALPYHNIDGNESLIIEDVPDSLIPRQKLSGKDKVPCLLCGQKEITVKDMRKHVGGHILRDIRDCAAPHECKSQAIGEDPCGFCGLDGCLTQLKKKDGRFTITSTCPYHYPQMQYRSAAQFSKSSPCTNVPIHCPICPSSISQVPQTIWKYNALFHLASEHSTGTTPPTITGQLLVDMFISKEEEKALKIEEEITDLYRKEYNIPDTDGLLEMKEEWEKRKRSESVSTVSSDKPGSKRPKVDTIDE